MGTIMTPTTALMYAYVNLGSSDLPSEPPEDDVFARAFKNATRSRPESKEEDIFCVSIKDSLDNRRSEIVFDEFLSNDTLSFGKASLSSNGSSSGDRVRSDSAASIQSSTTTLSSSHNFEKSEQASEYQIYRAIPPTAIANFSRFDFNSAGLENPDRSPNTFVNTLPSPHIQAIIDAGQRKQPRRRRSKRKIRTEEEEATKRKAFLERNRMAAQKCRSRKKAKNGTLEEDLAKEEQKNAKLRWEIGELTAELATLRDVYTQCERECGFRKSQKEDEKEPSEMR